MLLLCMSTILHIFENVFKLVCEERKKQTERECVCNWPGDKMRRSFQNNQISFGCLVTNPVFALSMRFWVNICHSQPVLLFLFCIQMFSAHRVSPCASLRLHAHASCNATWHKYGKPVWVVCVCECVVRHDICIAIRFEHKGYENRFSHSVICFHRQCSQRCHRRSLYSFATNFTCDSFSLRLRLCRLSSTSRSRFLHARLCRGSLFQKKKWLVSSLLTATSYIATRNVENEIPKSFAL